MFPELLVQISLIIIAVRCGYVALKLIQSHNKQWLDIAFYISIVIVMLSILF
jgi:hypothetical protein